MVRHIWTQLEVCDRGATMLVMTPKQLAWLMPVLGAPPESIWCSCWKHPTAQAHGAFTKDTQEGALL